MKKIVVTLMMLAAIGIACEANTPSSLVVTMKSSSSFDICYKGAGKKTVRITITDAQGMTLFKRMVKHTHHFNLPVSLRALMPGKYYVIAHDGTGRIVKEVWTTGDDAPLRKERKVLGHIFDLGGGKYLVTMRSFMRGQPIEIKIYDSLNRLVQREAVTVNSEKAIVFNTRRVKGTPKFVLSDPDRKAEIIQN